MIAVKAHSLPAAAPSIRHLLGERTALVTALNGVPWWYFYKSGGEHEERACRASIPAASSGSCCRRAGRSAASSTRPPTSSRPGSIEHTYSNRFDLGEPDGTKSERRRRSRS